MGFYCMASLHAECPDSIYDLPDTIHAQGSRSSSVPQMPCLWLACLEGAVLPTNRMCGLEPTELKA